MLRANLLPECLVFITLVYYCFVLFNRQLNWDLFSPSWWVVMCYRLLSWHCWSIYCFVSSDVLSWTMPQFRCYHKERIKYREIVFNYLVWVHTVSLVGLQERHLHCKNISLQPSPGFFTGNSGGSNMTLCSERNPLQNHTNLLICTRKLSHHFKVIIRLHRMSPFCPDNWKFHDVASLAYPQSPCDCLGKMLVFLFSAVWVNASGMNEWMNDENL